MSHDLFLNLKRPHPCRIRHPPLPSPPPPPPCNLTRKFLLKDLLTKDYAANLQQSNIGKKLYETIRRVLELKSSKPQPKSNMDSEKPVQCVHTPIKEMFSLFE